MSSPIDSRPSFQRRAFLVAPAFQLKWSGALAAMGGAVSLLFGALMFQAHQAAVRSLELPDEVIEPLLAADTHQLGLVALISVVMAGVLASFGILVTHRIAGPMVVLERQLRELGRHGLARPRPLRQGDEMQELWRALDGAVVRLRELEGRQVEALTELLQAAQAQKWTAEQTAVLGRLLGEGKRRLE